MNDLELFFADSSLCVDEKLGKIVSDAGIEPNRLYEAVRWSLFAGGKRFRPALLLAVGSTLGAADEKLLSSAAAVEMIHTYSLVHDDLPAMDDDDLRRGRETCHKKFGEATAILVGDILQTLAFRAIAEDKTLSDEIKIKLIAELGRAAAKMVEGQHLDLEAEGKDVSMEELEIIHQNKTGALIRFSAKAGSVIAEANEKEFEAISNYAAKLGLLFQITDDLLDVTQTTQALGKTAGKDISARKATYPNFYGIEEARRFAEKIHAEANRSLDNIDKPTQLLQEIAGYILKRKS